MKKMTFTFYRKYLLRKFGQKRNVALDTFWGNEVEQEPHSGNGFRKPISE